MCMSVILKGLTTSKEINMDKKGDRTNYYCQGSSPPSQWLRQDSGPMKAEAMIVHPYYLSYWR